MEILSTYLQTRIPSVPPGPSLEFICCQAICRYDLTQQSSAKYLMYIYARDHLSAGRCPQRRAASRRVVLAHCPPKLAALWCLHRWVGTHPLHPTILYSRHLIQLARLGQVGMDGRDDHLTCTWVKHAYSREAERAGIRTGVVRKLPRFTCTPTGRPKTLAPHEGLDVQQLVR